MLARANKSKAESGKDNVSFVESKITDITLDSGIADCIISNCVINLIPGEEKQLAFNEMFRLLKVGGRLAVSDILLKKTLPENLQSCVALYTGCIAGASQVADYEKYLKTAGFERESILSKARPVTDNPAEIMIKDTNADLNVYLETNADGTEKAKSSHESGGTQCCGVVTKDETAAACQTGQCCSGGGTQDESCGGCGVGRELRNELKGQSLNDFAGKLTTMSLGIQQTLTHCSRIV